MTFPCVSCFLLVQSVSTLCKGEASLYKPPIVQASDNECLSMVQRFAKVTTNSTNDPLERKESETSAVLVKPQEDVEAKDEHFSLLELDELDAAPEKELRIQIFGLYNTGTDILTILEDAVHPHANVCPGGGQHNTKIQCRNNTAPSTHASPVLVQEWFDSSASKNHRNVFVTRSPFSWLASMKLHPYGFSSCIQADSKDWLSATCFCNSMVEMGVKDDVCAHGQVSYSSITDVWNQYMAAYKRIVKSTSRWAAIVRYEDLVRKPAASVRSLDSHLGFHQSHASKSRRIIDEAATANGNGREAALEAMEERSYRKQLSDDESETICRLIDRKLLKDFGYADECVHPGGSLAAPTSIRWMRSATGPMTTTAVRLILAVSLTIIVVNLSS